LSFFSTHTAPTPHYTLSLHDALPISGVEIAHRGERPVDVLRIVRRGQSVLHIVADFDRFLERSARNHRNDRPEDLFLRDAHLRRSEEHTSELQSLAYLVCRLLLEKKK